MSTISQRCLNDGNTVVALKSNTEIGSPKYLTRSTFVFVSSVKRLPRSVANLLPISAPSPASNPPSANPIAASTEAPIPAATPVPKSNIPFLIIVLPNSPNDDPTLPLTTGAPYVLDCIKPYGISPLFCIVFLMIVQLLRPSYGQ